MPYLERTMLVSAIHQTALRPACQVMRLARLGSLHQCRLSFMRTLLRGLAREGWRFERRLWEIDAKGVGRAVYTAQGPERAYSLIAFAHDLPPEMRSDRVIATAWDATFALMDGIPDADDLDRLAANVPYQEAGRVSAKELSLSRANRSVRMWDHVVDRLAAGQQPDAGLVEEVGYLMRTTAVYGSGKFGAADRGVLAGRGLMDGPFRAEMLSVWLTRAFTVDLVEHMARAKGGDGAEVLDPALRRRLGVGNSTGLGMAPYLVNHPLLLNNWILARETALARVRAIPCAGAVEIAAFRAHLASARENARNWVSAHPIQTGKLEELTRDLDRLAERFDDLAAEPNALWERLLRWAEDALGLEGQEQLVSLLLEPYPDLVDDLAAEMGADEAEAFAIDGSVPVADFRDLLAQNYAWATAPDFNSEAAHARFWYVSEEKLEPRLGERFEEPGADLEQPLAVGRDIALLRQALADWPGAAPLADFLNERPEHRHAVRRAQLSANHPYSEIRDNLIDASMLPIDMLRAKLSFFGATRFDPRSDRWVRITMYQGAPYPHELAPENADGWVYSAQDGGAAP